MAKKLGKRSTVRGYKKLQCKYCDNICERVDINAAKLNNECIILPSYPELKDIEIEYISDIVKKFSIECYQNKNT